MQAGQLTKPGYLFLLSAILLIGCSTGLEPALHLFPDKASGDIIDELVPEIEALYLEWRQLDGIYKDLKYVERGLLWDADDRQLGYTQKAAQFVQDALLRIHHRWEQLSVLGYIRPDHLQDYLTICADALARCVDQTGADRRFLTIYDAFIVHDAVRQDLSRAHRQIELIEARMQQIHTKLQPFVHPSMQPTGSIGPAAKGWAPQGINKTPGQSPRCWSTAPGPAA